MVHDQYSRMDSNIQRGFHPARWCAESTPYDCLSNQSRVLLDRAHQAPDGGYNGS
jgi:hypothetical protein